MCRVIKCNTFVLLLRDIIYSSIKQNSCVMNSSRSEPCWNLNKTRFRTTAIKIKQQKIRLMVCLCQKYIHRSELDYFSDYNRLFFQCSRPQKLWNVNKIRRLVRGSRISTIECLGTVAFTCLADPLYVFHSMFLSQAFLWWFNFTISVLFVISTTLVQQLFSYCHTFAHIFTLFLNVNSFIHTTFSRLVFPRFWDPVKFSCSFNCLTMKIFLLFGILLLLIYELA